LFSSYKDRQYALKACLNLTCTEDLEHNDMKNILLCNGAQVISFFVPTLLEPFNRISGCWIGRRLFEFL